VTYQPDWGGQYRLPSGGPPRPPASGPDWTLHSAAPQWTTPAPSPLHQLSRKRRAMVIIMMVVLVAAAGVLTLVSTVGRGSSTWVVGDHSSSPVAAPSAASTSSLPGGASPGNARRLPPPTPTGAPYEDDDPAVGDCVDVARRPTGVVIYQAACGDPAATLILDSVQSDNCPSKGFFGLDSLSKQVLCFTYAFKTGDCVDLEIPRRVACIDQTSPNGGTPLVTVDDIRLGQQDGNGCVDPELFLQVGKEKDRGIACLKSGSHRQTTTTAPSR
jgi:hypothetical protein